MPQIIRPSIIDVEASGFSSHSYPIEIGLVLDSGERYCSLIKPASNWIHWDDKAENVHNITKEILEKHGKPIEIVAEKVNDLLKNRTIYTDGWVVDKPWVDQLFYKAGISKLFSISSLEMILTESQMEIWHDIKDQVIDEYKLKRHRASIDAFIIQETYFRTKYNNFYKGD